MAKFTIASTYPSNDPHVHKTGCQDVTRGIARRKYDRDPWDVECDTAEDAALIWWSDIIAESEDEAEAGQAAKTVWTKIFPCAK